jgi:zinc transporter 1/2/3
MLIAWYMGTFALITPLGIGIGIALTETATDDSSLQNVVVTVLQGLAAGTLIYVVFFEVLEKERLKKSNGLVQVTIFHTRIYEQNLIFFLNIDKKN